MPGTVLVIGATRGLGACLAQQYLARGWTVLGTARGATAPAQPAAVTWLPGIDLTQPSVGDTLAAAVRPHAPLDLAVVVAGLLKPESFDKPDWDAQVAMYTTCAIGPTFAVNRLAAAGLLREKGGKVVLVSSEAGSVALRHSKEGGGMYGHHASKAALNMAGKLLSLDLRDRGIAVGMVHPGFMKTEMTKSVGFDKFYEDGGAVTPDQAASDLITFIDGFGMDKTGQFWAPRGPAGIGTIEETVGKGLPTPLQLPW